MNQYSREPNNIRPRTLTSHSLENGFILGGAVLAGVPVQAKYLHVVLPSHSVVNFEKLVVILDEDFRLTQVDVDGIEIYVPLHES